jgi:hypothetical protein
MKSLAQQFADVYEKMGVQNVSPDSLLPWLQCVRDQNCPSFDRDSQIRLGAVTMEQVMEVHKTLFDTRSGNLVVQLLTKMLVCCILKMQLHIEHDCCPHA